jgi:hypothetical protein
MVKGCKTKIQFIKKNDIQDWIYGRQKQDIWKISDGSSCRYDRVFVNINHFDDMVVDIDDDEIVAEDMLPTIILTKREQFKDNDGNVHKVHVMGERTVNGCYFSVADVSVAFNMKKLSSTITHVNCEYKYGEHYRSYLSYGGTPARGERKKEGKIKQYLTYDGLLKVLYSSRNSATKGFTKWATETLFTAHMGTNKQKCELVKNMDIPHSYLLKMLKNSVSLISCIYLFKITVDDKTAYKYGFTKDLKQRSERHKKSFGEISLVMYGCIDPDYISKAETGLRKRLNEMDAHIKYKDFKEIVSLDASQLNIIRDTFKVLTDKYAGTMDSINKQMDALRVEHDKELLRKDNDLLKKDKDLLRKDNDLLKKDLIIANMNAEIVQERSKVEILDLKLQLAELKNSKK